MQSNTINFSGFSREETAQLEGLLKQAREALGVMWSIDAENDAQVVVADMDSMYGQMGFLKARGNGKTTVGVTSGSRADADHTLTRPVGSADLQALLQQLGAVLPKAVISAPAEVEANVAARITGQQPALSPRVTGQQPAMTVRQTGQQPALPAQDVGKASVMAPMPEKTTGQQPALDPRSTAERAAVGVPAAPPPPKELSLLQWLRQGQSGAARLRASGAPDLVIDFVTQSYSAGATLKPLQPYASLIIQDGQVEELSSGQAEAELQAAGGKQPLSRLMWFLALQSGSGRLTAGQDPNGRFKLDKWPQTEREFPKHFRIATVMMKGPATLMEISEQSGAPLNEVIDYVNASLTSGHTSAV